MASTVVSAVTSHQVGVCMFLCMGIFLATLVFSYSKRHSRLTEDCKLALALSV